MEENQMPVNPAPVPGPMPPMEPEKGSKGKKILIAALVILLALFFITGSLFSYLARRAATDNPFSNFSSNDYGGNPFGESGGGSSSVSSTSVCGNWPAASEEHRNIFQANGKVQSGLLDVPVYQDMEPIGTLGAAGISLGRVFCSDSSVKALFDFYKNYSSTTWGPSQNVTQYIPPDSPYSIKTSWSNEVQEVYLEKKSGHILLYIQLFESAGKTVIIMMGGSIDPDAS